MITYKLLVFVFCFCNTHCTEENAARVQVIIHKLLVITIFFCVAAIAAEAALPANPVVSLMRAGFVMLQGTWFMQVAKMMYNGVCG